MNLDFGEAWESSAFVWEVTIRNRMGDRVVVEDFGNTCHCSKVEPRSFVIAPHGSQAVRAILDLTYAGKETTLTARTVREFAVSLTPKIAGPLDAEEIPSWTLQGRVRSSLRVEPFAVNLGRQSELSQPLAVQSVRVFGLTEFETLQVQADPTIQARIESLDRDKREFSLKVRPRDNLPLGRFDSRIALVPILADGSSLPGKEILVNGEIVHDIQMTPHPLLFGPKPVGETVEENIAIESLSGRSFRVTRVEVPSKDIEAIPESGSRYRIRQRVTHRTNQSNAIRFHIVAADGAESIVSLEVRYYGLPE